MGWGFRAEAKLNNGGNSGVCCRAEFGPRWTKGYESEVNNSPTDPVRTGSLYGIVKIFDKLVDDDTWWTQNIRAEGQHIVIKVNGKVVVDHMETKNLYTSGYLALQQHDPGSVVHYRNLRMRPIGKK